MDMQCIFPSGSGLHLLMAGFASIGYLRGKTGLRELSFESNVSAFDYDKQNLSGKECVKALLALSCGCISICLFLTVLWVGLQCVTMAFLGHTHLLLKLTFSIHFLKVLQQEFSLMMPIVICMSSKSGPDYESGTLMKR